jgi:hypothetical protein
VVGIAAFLQGWQGKYAALDPVLSGSLQPLSGMAATPVGRQVPVWISLGLAVYTKPLLGLDRHVFGRPLDFEGRRWGTPVRGHGPGALYRY